MRTEKQGRVLLVGAGPGAADLLTIRALRAIESADVVMLDALVSDDVRALLPTRAKCIHVGKRGHRRSTSQDFINRLMARLARGGAIVVRLKGGDPSIFGRAGEERAFLEARGVSVEVIAGITTASAAAARFAFALTERGQARRVLFATGRTHAGAQTEWAMAADAETTLCLYMARGDIAAIVEHLMQAGRAPDTPALAAINVERPAERLVKATLATLAEALSNEDDAAPVFIAIGAVCAGASVRSLRDACAPLAIRQAC